MPEPAFAIYVTRQGADDADAAKETMRALGSELRPRYDDGRLTGFEVVAVLSDEHYVDYEIDEEWLAEEQVGPPPFLYVHVGWDQARPGPGIDDLIARYALRELAYIPNPR
jgi:hypothetical protein